MNELERRQRIETVCVAALEQPPVDRAAYVAAACGDDEGLRRDVETLLDHAATADGLLQAFLARAPHATVDMTTEPADFTPGCFVGPYVIVGRVGHGGMGEVFIGTDPRLHRKVALKCLFPTNEPTDESRLRLLHEARAAARINHPNVAAVHDVVETAGRTFIVMEYVEGESLAFRLQNGPLPVETALRMARQLASALVAAHARGIIHRDLKPGNIQVTPDGGVKVLDFGVAAAVAILTSSATTLSSLDGGIPVRGPQPGTLGYMSPEQMLGREVDFRSDIFSLGVVLYESLCGVRPFPGRDHTEVLSAFLTQPAAVHRLNFEVPQDFSRIISRAIETDVAQRFASAVELERALLGTTRPSGLRELRERLLAARSHSEIRHLKYEVEQYLSTQPHDVDARMLSDDVNRALFAHQYEAPLTIPRVEVSSVPRVTARTPVRSRLRYAVPAVLLAAAAATSGGLFLLRSRSSPTPSVAWLAPPVPANPLPKSAADSARSVSLPTALEATRLDRRPTNPGVNSTDVSGITRLPGEDDAAWQARGRRVHENYELGTAHLGKLEYKEAIAAFEQVLRDQPEFLDAGRRLIEAQTGKAFALREALNNATQGEKSGTPSGLFSALKWYEKAYSLDQSAETLGHVRVTRERVAKEANVLFERAKVYQSLGEKSKARDLLQNVISWLPDDDPVRTDAVKRLESLK